MPKLVRIHHIGTTPFLYHPHMRLRVLYAGRVQGVGFRVTARSIMSRFPVTGWVRNEPDETVLLELQGADEAVRSALSDLRSSMGRNIQSEDTSPIDELSGERRFEITH